MEQGGGPKSNCQSHLKDAYKKYLGLCRKITKMVRSQTHEEGPQRRIRKMVTKRIGDKMQSKGPRRGRGRKASDVINKLGIFSVDMDYLSGEKFFVYISTGFSSIVDSLFVRRPKGVCVI